MPTYEYKCDRCDYRFEAFQSMTAEPLSECPECGGKTRRLISPGAGFIFKGSGFYITDYRSDGYRKAQKAEKDSSGSGSADKGTDKGKEKTKTAKKDA
jgi:putative FmdB family regulatory protein